MRTWRWRMAVGAISAAAVLGMAGCGDDDDDGGTTAPQVDPDPVTLEILGATVPPGGRPTVTFRVLDANNQPIDVDAELATTTTFPRLTTARFTVAMLDANDDYVSYYATTTRVPSAYTYVPDPEIVATTFVPPRGTFDEDTGRVTFATPSALAVSQAQQNSVTRANLTAVQGQNRVYQFTFPTPTFTTGMDQSRTHTIAGQVIRAPNSSDTDASTASFNFIPSGTGTVQKIETITDDGCNRCHGALQAHGSRRGVQYCIACHSPQTTDPETGYTVDFKVMIHKIHYGSGLPSVRQAAEGLASGAPYYIVGNSQNVHDYSGVAFPWHDHGVQHCTVCHVGEDADNWKSKPSLKACGSCHDNVSFAADDPARPSCASLSANDSFLNCDHSAGPIAAGIANPSATSACISCHGVGASAAVERFHHGD